jgi:hypothetical protein
MKNQYFGDINDYRKYGLLRTLSRGGNFKLGICWMLTPDDATRDGLKRNHVIDPGKWRHYDPELLERLSSCNRGVVEAENPRFFRKANFWSRTLADDGDLRSQYFRAMLQKFRGVDLIFFDPDNGMEVKSRPYGRKHSSKYLYWFELREAFAAGSSILVYQHFCRENRDLFINRLSRQFHGETQAGSIFSFRTAHVVFFLAVQPKHLKHLDFITADLKQWEDQITLKHHRF